MPKRLVIFCVVVGLLFGLNTSFAQAQESTTKYFFAVYEETDGIATKYYSLPGGATAVRKDNELSYLHSDHLSSTRLMTDDPASSAGGPSLTAGRQDTVNSQIDYYPYGTIFNFSAKGGPATGGQFSIYNEFSISNSETDHLYTSQVLDNSTDLYFYNARQYNPRTASFISADSAQGPNRYAYVAGNPISRNDPSGNAYDPETGGGGDKNIRKEKDPTLERIFNIIHNLPRMIDELRTCDRSPCSNKSGQNLWVKFSKSEWESLYDLGIMFSALKGDIYPAKYLNIYRSPNILNESPSSTWYGDVGSADREGSMYKIYDSTRDFEASGFDIIKNLKTMRSWADHPQEIIDLYLSNNDPLIFSGRVSNPFFQALGDVSYYARYLDGGKTSIYLLDRYDWFVDEQGMKYTSQCIGPYCIPIMDFYLGASGQAYIVKAQWEIDEQTFFSIFSPSRRLGGQYQF